MSEIQKIEFTGTSMGDLDVMPENQEWGFTLDTKKKKEVVNQYLLKWGEINDMLEYKIVNSEDDEVTFFTDLRGKEIEREKALKGEKEDDFIFRFLSNNIAKREPDYEFGFEPFPSEFYTDLYRVIKVVTDDEIRLPFTFSGYISTKEGYEHTPCTISISKNGLKWGIGYPDCQYDYDHEYWTSPKTYQMQPDDLIFADDDTLEQLEKYYEDEDEDEFEDELKQDTQRNEIGYIKNMIFSQELEKVLIEDVELMDPIDNFRRKWNFPDTNANLVSNISDGIVMFFPQLTKMREKDSYEAQEKKWESKDVERDSDTKHYYRFFSSNVGNTNNVADFGVEPFPREFYTDLYNLIKTIAPGSELRGNFQGFIEGIYGFRDFQWKLTSDGLEWEIVTFEEEIKQIEEIRELDFKDKFKKYQPVNEKIKNSIEEFKSKWDEINRMTQYGLVALTPDGTQCAFLFDLTLLSSASSSDPNKIKVQDLNSEDGLTRFRTKFACRFLNFGLPEHNLTLGVKPFPQEFYADFYNLMVLCVPEESDSLEFNFFAEKQDKEVDKNYYWCRGLFTSEGIEWKISTMKSRSRE